MAERSVAGMDRYQREESFSIYWFNRASDLYGGAGAIWFAMEHDNDEIRSELEMSSSYSFSVACPAVFWMLCGLSLELLYKAIAMEIGKEIPHDHKLRQLSVLAEIDMTTSDLELLDILTDHVYWAGKYPTPSKGRPDWDRHVDRMHTALTEPVSIFGIEAFRRNNRLDWKDYSRIWNNGQSHYWKVTQ